MKFTFKKNHSNIKRLEEAGSEALAKTAEALHTEVVQAQVMPFDTGNMQNENTFVRKVNDNKYQLVTNTEYASRLYYHPEFNFNTASNPNARGRWLEPWIDGDKKDFCADTFKKFMEEEKNKRGV